MTTIKTDESPIKSQITKLFPLSLKICPIFGHSGDVRCFKKTFQPEYYFFTKITFPFISKMILFFYMLLGNYKSPKTSCFRSKRDGHEIFYLIFFTRTVTVTTFFKITYEDSPNSLDPSFGCPLEYPILHEFGSGS